jgi:nucleoside-diphosphate-sugar epimerase
VPARTTPRPITVISGATGMTGNEVARQLLACGHRVVGFDNLFASSTASIEDLAEMEDFDFFEYDLNDTTAMDALERFLLGLEAGGELSFVNCAAVVHTKHFYEPSSTFETNVVAMKAFLEQAIRLGAAKFINCSTSEVYSLASFAEGGVKEEDALCIAGADVSQRASYAVGKLLTEYFLKEACLAERIRGCSIRFANVYSNDELLPEHIIPYTVQTLSRGSSITLLENARRTSRTFLHNRDSCSAVVALLENESALDGSSYNVGTDEEINIVALVEKIAALMDVRDLQITFEGMRTADPERRLLNTDRLRSRTGWFPAVSLDDGIGMCVDYALAGERRTGA